MRNLIRVSLCYQFLMSFSNIFAEDSIEVVKKTSVASFPMKAIPLEMIFKLIVEPVMFLFGIKRMLYKKITPRHLSLTLRT